MFDMRETKMEKDDVILKR